MIALSPASDSPVTRSTCQGWRLPPVAARAALTTIALSVAESTGLSRNPRTDRRAATASVTFIQQLQISIIGYARAPLPTRRDWAREAHKDEADGESSMAEAYIVEAVRTAGGKRGGKLAGWHPVDMAASVLDAVIARTGI